MNKLSIFVEGQTELLFCEHLLNSVASARQLSIDMCCASGGTTAPFRLKVLRRQQSPTARHYIQIVDCSSDGNVKPYIMERYSNLVRQGFWAVLGIRDVFPKVSHSQIASLRAGLANGVKTKPVDVVFFLGIMEIESWFIAEHTHFQKISDKLSITNVVSALGYDPISANLELRPNPAADLDQIYRFAGFRYTKRQANCQRTLKCLDYAAIYLEVKNRFTDLEALIQKIDVFLALP